MANPWKLEGANHLLLGGHLSCMGATEKLSQITLISITYKLSTKFFIEHIHVYIR